MKEIEKEGIARAINEGVINRFYTVIYELPVQQREIVLCSLKGKKTRDIAFRLQISENTVKTQKKRAYDYLRKHLENGLSLALIILFY